MHACPLMNQKKSGAATVLDVDPVGVCLLQILKQSRKKSYQNTVYGLMKELMQTAEKMGMDSCCIPCTSRLLCVCLKVLRDVLKEDCGICLSIGFGGGAKWIRITC